jgi:hypothetical protein
MNLYKTIRRIAQRYFRRPLVFYIALPNTQVPRLNVPEETSFVSTGNKNEYLNLIENTKYRFAHFLNSALKTEQYLVFCTMIIINI